MSYFELPLYELIELVHVHIHKELACEVTERKSDAVTGMNVETIDDLLKQPDRILVGDPASEDTQQNLVVDVGEKFPNVAFEHPCRARVIPGNFA